jgi:hypothetical protein
MRKLLRDTILADSGLMTAIPAARWIQAGAVDNPPARPFAVIRITDARPSVSRSSQPSVQIWVHDDRGSYSRIDSTLKLIREYFATVFPLENATERIVCAEWAGDSPDLVDEGYNTNTRYSSFTLTGRK